jgi:hypothetical protein
MSATKSTKTAKSTKKARKSTKPTKSIARLKVQHAIMSNAGHLAWATTYRNRLKTTKSTATRKELKAKLAAVLANARVSAKLRQRVAA